MKYIDILEWRFNMSEYVKVRFAIDDEDGYESYLFKLEKEQCRDIVNYLMFISEPIGEEE